MTKKITTLVFSLFLVTGFAQKSLSYWETGLYIGSLNYSGEITEGGDIGAMLNETRPQFGIFVKRNFNAQINMGVELGYGLLYATDANHGNSERGFEMKTSLLMTNVRFDLNFKKFGKYYRRNRSTPYISLGGGALVFQPELQTGSSFEGYNLYPNSNYSYNIMTAFGWKFKTGERGVIGVSLNYHFSGVPYLEGYDDGSLGAKNDSYFGLRLTGSLGYYNN